MPNLAEDGGDEAEIAGVYLIGSEGMPYRLGLVQGNEFSDHVTESKNYLYLAPSKLRQCAIGPELVVGADFADVPGRIAIERGRDLSGRRESPAARRTCAIHWSTWSTTISNTTSIAGLATCMFTFSAPIISASATACGCTMAT